MSLKDELERLLHLYASLESKRMWIGKNDPEVTKRELDKLGADVAYLKLVIARAPAFVSKLAVPSI